MVENMTVMRTTPYMWRNDNGSLAAGDTHPSEPESGAGLIHIASGFNPMNPERPIGDALETVRHEIGHFVLNLPQGSTPATDPAGILARQCGGPP